MCGRITLREPRKAVAAFLGGKVSELPPPRFNLAPGEEQLVVRVSEETGRRELCRLFWGFVPHWSREAKPSPIINARSESVADKPAFRQAFRHRRCLLLADGFYEWRRRERERLPFLFTLRDEESFGVAAIWETRMEGGRRRDGFCLLTTAANSVTEPIHDRMPVILDEEGAARWLGAATENELVELCRPFPPERMEVRPVSPFVNKIGNQGPACIEPFDGGDEQLLLF